MSHNPKQDVRQDTCRCAERGTGDRGRPRAMDHRSRHDAEHRAHSDAKRRPHHDAASHPRHNVEPESDYDVVVIGAGLSGLTAASLLAKRGLRVAVVEAAQHPGGSCGVFKREGVTYDQGTSMLFGFGEHGFNAHRFLFNCLEEPLELVRHDLLYCMNFAGHRIRFWADINLFVNELSAVFPSEAGNIRRFYSDIGRLYQHVLIENPSYCTPDETNPRESLRGLLAHPLSYMRFLRLLNTDARTLLARYFSDPAIFNFFDKLTSTYCYTTLEESPAILAAVMFVDNHVGGSYYPAGSSMFLPGTLEKVIEEHGGDMLMNREVTAILMDDDGSRARGVRCADGCILSADDIIYSGTVWNLYGHLLDHRHVTAKQRTWARGQVPTYPSLVLYLQVDRDVIPEDTAAVEMLVGNPERLDESEITVYIPSIDDHTICPEGSHVIIAIGPSFQTWDKENHMAYQQGKARETQRLLAVLERRFPGFVGHIRAAEMATPDTIERYTHKNGGAVAGPKQMLGQHLLKRQHTRTAWGNLFCCGESTVMGTGSPTVTVSGISAANTLLRKRGMEPFVYRPERAEQVRIITGPYTWEDRYRSLPPTAGRPVHEASRCHYCAHPSCTDAAEDASIDIPGIMRRVSVGNYVGARRLLDKARAHISLDATRYARLESRCLLAHQETRAVGIGEVLAFVMAQGEDTSAPAARETARHSPDRTPASAHPSSPISRESGPHDFVLQGDFVLQNAFALQGDSALQDEDLCHAEPQRKARAQR